MGFIHVSFLVLFFGVLTLTPGLLHHLHVEPLGRRTFEDKGATGEGSRCWICLLAMASFAGRYSTIENADCMEYEWDT